ncbi:MAG: hypothetical protein ACXVNM_08900 [Bacteroidia bacterium]
MKQGEVRFNNKIKLLTCLLILVPFKYTIAQIVISEEPKRLYYDFAIKRVKKFKDMNNFRDVFHLNKFLMGKNRISGNISYNTGRVLISEGAEVKEEYRQALAFYTKIRFFEEFSINTTFFVDFNKRATARWISDYSYTIGRYNWRPNKFNYGYENYLNNKYSNDLSEVTKKFLEGYYFLSYSHNLPDRITKAISLDGTTNVKFVYFTRYAIKYRDEFNEVHGGFMDGKSTSGIAVRYTFYKNIYIESALYYYAEPFKRQPWDPDYTYGFGYFDWRSFRISITYGNWAINRFDASKKPYSQYGFIDGQFRFIFNWIW